MSTANELNRKIDGGVVGGFTPITQQVDCAGLTVADKLLGIKIPAGRLPIAVYLKNVANDLTSDGSATVQIKIGSTGVGSAVAKADLKGKGVYQVISTPAISLSEQSVYLTVGTAALTAGNLEVGVIYV